ncbi:hypothetical protein BDN72DRAFT_399365 [Pluteus cervinus]|uniref:Uncharacterized protein n=1 Tax=Pluteus cervinus TaxID=181527 RepID=A0ACD3B1E0_9AGAR|nr:hypothetical protein BDN72DRAFT_399365 [Pluteus cervinus]
MQSFSVPSSPAVPRSSKNHPVTPQRSAPRHRHSQSLYRSPITPNSPYTPLSLRSFASSTSNGSSTLTTPNSAGDNSLSLKCLSIASPEVPSIGTANRKDHSLADIAQNWRSRASENGIKVTHPHATESQFGDDEVSDNAPSDTANESDFLTTEEVLLPPPFLSTQRRTAASRPRAQSHATLPTNRPIPPSPTIVRNNARVAPISPLNTRRISSLNQSQNFNLTSTPPPNRALSRQLKLKGSLTDPAQPRRREAFGVVRTPSQNTTHHDTSLDLFDIDENDFEYDYQHPDDEDSFAMDVNANNTFSFHPIYQQAPQSRNLNHLLSTLQHPFGDPFHATNVTNIGGGHVLNSINENLEHHFHAGHGAFLPAVAEEGAFYAFAGQNQGRGLGMYPTPAYVPIPPASAPAGSTAFTPFPVMPGLAAGFTLSQTPTITGNVNLPRQDNNTMKKSSTEGKNVPPAEPTVLEERKPAGCSVCLSPNPRTLAILVPCGHPLCSGCLTSALNIVGEKDMECAVCKRGVEDFRLQTATGNDSKDASQTKSSGSKTMEVNKEPATPKRAQDDGAKGKSFLDPLFSSPGTSISGRDLDLDPMFEFGEIRASTPKLERRESSASEKAVIKYGDNVVLRIDNVPWDITPPQIKRWLQQPIERVHVLLDPKGKTMSHAFVEVRDGEIAGSILRGEAASDGSGKKRGRGSVLGRGKRARGVTITRSGQEELMADLFPNWKGTFDGPRPSLAGLDGDSVITALEGGLINENELRGLLHLIREPDSHFLKVPCLPFHSLISLLSKFPLDVDSRVFWNAGVRDLLFDVTYAAIQVLLPRVDRAKTPAIEDEYTMDLVVDLAIAAMKCREAFTVQQNNQLMTYLETSSIPVPPVGEYGDDDRSSNTTQASGMSQPRTPANRITESPNHGYVISGQRLSAQKRDTPTLNNPNATISDLAKEFGVEAQLVQALAHRLSGMC